jgi:hypothetical protein
MIRNHVVVDGSNIATEGRSSPSLRQLDEAVRAFLEEHPTEHVTVVVDATFGHRIDESERPEFENAVNASELITAPAGTIGRGDAFVLQVADKGDASILSNDSFQEFHGQYTWLFDEGRLIGGKPVPPVGWVFLLRSPVRGPASRRAVKEAKDGKPSRGKAGRDKADGDKKSKRGGKAKDDKGARPKSDRGETKTDIAGKSGDKSDKRDKKKSKAKPTEPLNDPLPFIEFVGAHPIGTVVEGEVSNFSSHGAYVETAGVHCYVPLKLMGDPPPRSAKDILRLGEKRNFAVHAFDVPRRGIDLAMIAGDTHESQKTTSEQDDRVPAKQPARAPRPRKARAKKASTKKRTTNSSAQALDVLLTPAEEETAKTHTKASGLATTTHADQRAEEAPVTPARKKKAAAKKAARKTAAKRGSKKATAKRTSKKKASAKKRSTAKRSAKRSSAKRGAKKAAKKRPSKKRATKKRASKKRAAKRRPAKRKAASKKRSTKKRASKKRASKKRAPARKKKAASKKRPSKRKASAKRRSTRRR